MTTSMEPMRTDIAFGGSCKKMPHSLDDRCCRRSQLQGLSRKNSRMNISGRSMWTERNGDPMLWHDGRWGRDCQWKCAVKLFTDPPTRGRLEYLCVGFYCQDLTDRKDKSPDRSVCKRRSGTQPVHQCCGMTSPLRPAFGGLILTSLPFSSWIKLTLVNGLLHENYIY